MTTAHQPCRHRAYRMTCAEYDELYARANGRCEICGVLEKFAQPARLVIDHDSPIGMHAVRGLLCNRCNSSLDLPCMAGPDLDRYIATAWYLTSALRLSVTPDAGPARDAALASLTAAVEVCPNGGRSETVVAFALEALRAGVQPGTVYAAVPYTGNWIRLRARRVGIAAGKGGRAPSPVSSLRVT